MIYKFKSKATGDVIMLGPNGDQMLRLIGHEPAAKGIIEVAAMPEALTRIAAAIAAAEAARQQPSAEDDGASSEPVGLRQRLWPMVEMLREAQAAGEPIVWGV